MSKLSRPRKGSLQFYPRKRTSKILPSVNWSTIQSKPQGLQGFIAYKAGMASAIVKDSTEKTMTAGKQIAVPVTILEVPSMKIYSVRFYKFGRVINEIVVSQDKELKRVVRVPKQIKTLDQHPKDYEDIRVIIYSMPKQTSIKKTPDLIEVAVQSENKLEFVKSLIGKELSLEDFPKFDILDVRGVTRGKGLQGPVKRFGLSLKQHKTEKGVRRPGSLAPWHPARVTFHAPMAGQMGYFTRIIYNIRVLSQGKIKDKNINPKTGWKNYGNIKTSYIIIKGSVQGPVKRQILLTPAFRPSKIQTKRKFEFLELVA